MAISSGQEACLLQATLPSRSLSLSLQVLPMTPLGYLYLVRVCGAPLLLLLLGLLLALPPEAQVRQQENEVCGDGLAKPWALEPSSILFSPRGSLVLVSRPQLPGLSISTPRITSYKAPPNPPLTLLVNIHLLFQIYNPSPPPTLLQGPKHLCPPSLPQLSLTAKQRLLPPSALPTIPQGFMC